MPLMGHERRNAILQSLRGAERPVSGTALADAAGVSRQVIVQDIALLRVASKIMDDVTTTDELIPSGETSSYRSNPLGLAEFTLSRRDPEYVGRAKAVDELEAQRLEGAVPAEVAGVFDGLAAAGAPGADDPASVEIGSTIYAVKPGDGSAREQAASCQRVLGGLANITREYATKRYRSNVMNWGMVPFQMKGASCLR